MFPMQEERGESSAALQPFFATALALTIVLPVLAVAGLAVSVWRLQNLQASNIATPWSYWLIGAAGAALLCALINGILWGQWRARLRRYLLGVTETCRASTEGAGQARVPVEGNDEFALLGASVNALLDQRGGVYDASEAATLQGQIERLLQEVSAVGEGDLSVQVEVTPDTLGVLADSFNYMIEELAKIVGRVLSTTQQVITATRRILDRSSQLARASEAQYAQISQTSDQVEELAAFILSAARNATLSANAAQDALSSSREGQAAVIQTIEGMQRIRTNVQETAKKIKRLGERSQEIGDIVRIIEDLSERTNLLALNATIQSTLGSDAGRNFTVVADEIRALAEQSSDAAKRIAVLVKSIQSETQEVVVAMEDSTAEVVNDSSRADNAGRALQEIYGAVETQARMVEDIARAANERAQTSEAVALAMNRISEITRQTSATMQDTAASVSYLAELAEQLRASVSTFRLPAGQQAGVIGAPQQFPPMLNAPRPTGAFPTPNTGGMPQPALPPGQQGGGWAYPLPPQRGPRQTGQYPAYPGPGQTPFPPAPDQGRMGGYPPSGADLWSDPMQPPDQMDGWRNNGQPPPPFPER
jgi:methyl-accepting chemotaxis protein